jgi:hypothetical protein
MIPGPKRGTAYGIFNALYGLALLGGSAAMGVLYGVSVPLLVGFVAFAELLAALSGVGMLRAGETRTRAP